MRRWFLLSATTAMAIAIAAPAARADEPVDDDTEGADEVKSGNAVDNATSDPAVGARVNMSPRAYEEMADFWGFFLAYGSPFHAALSVDPEDRDDFGFWSSPPSTGPIDTPAESILDEINDGPILLVGTPGGYYAQPASGEAAGATSGGTATPPPESILDYMDDSPPAPTPSAGAAPATANSAVNQAPTPAIVETPQE